MAASPSAPRRAAGRRGGGPLAFTACFTLLQVLFEYPDMLRRPTAEVLAKFQSGGVGLVTAWYALTLTAVLFIPVVILLHRVLAEPQAPLTLWIASAFGVVVRASPRAWASCAGPSWCST